MSDVQADQPATDSAAPAVSEAGEPTTPASVSAPVESSVAPASEAAPIAADATPSRESLIAHMHAKFDALEAKIKAGAVVFAHEVADLRDHIKSVL